MNGSPHQRSQVPPGVQCFLGEEARRRRRIEERVVSVFEGWAYEEIIPPLFDYADVFAGPALAPRTYTFVGRDGSLLALRPDFTSLLAKIAAGRLADRPAPLRLYYSGEVLRYEPPKAGRQSELHQMGLEHLGGVGPAADAETLAIAAECLDVGGCHRLGAGGRARGRLQRPRGRARARRGDARAAPRARGGEGRRGRARGAGGLRRRAGHAGRARASSRGSPATSPCSTRPPPRSWPGPRRWPRSPSCARSCTRWSRPGSARAWRSTSARCAGSTTTPASSSARTRAASGSRWAAAAGTTRCSRASDGRSRPSASCSGSTAWRCSSTGPRSARRSRRPRTSPRPTSRVGSPAPGCSAAEGRRVRLCGGTA